MRLLLLSFAFKYFLHYKATVNFTIMSKPHNSHMKNLTLYAKVGPSVQYCSLLTHSVTIRKQVFLLSDPFCVLMRGSFLPEMIANRSMRCFVCLSVCHLAIEAL